MNDVKDLFNRVLDTDAPRPVASRDAMLAVAHRAAARRRTRRTAAACAAAAFVIAAAVGVPRWLPAGTDGVTTGRDPGVTASPSSPAPPSTVTPERHAESMLKALLKRVPAEFTTPTTPTATDQNGVPRRTNESHVMDGQTPQLFAITDVYSGTKAGSTSVLVQFGLGAPPAGDLCVTGRPSHHAEQGCKVVTAANGTRIRVSWRGLPQIGRIDYAARFYQGGSVVVQQAPTLMDSRTTPIGRIFSEQAIADVAADPEFWPTNLAPFPGR